MGKRYDIRYVIRSKKVEENNKFETNESGVYSSSQNNLQNEGSAYGAETTEQTNSDVYSSVYDQPI